MFRDLINRVVSGTKKVVSGTKKVVTLPTLRTSSGEFLLKKTDFGLIRVDYVTVQKISERALMQVEGIKDPDLTVEKIASTITPMKIRLTVTLANGYSAPRVSEAAEKIINDALNDSLQMEFHVPVLVKVKQITQVETKRRRVR